MTTKEKMGSSGDENCDSKNLKIEVKIYIQPITYIGSTRSIIN
jgi:hypothetical protein